MKHLALSLLFISTICFQVRGQLTVSDDNNVGIGVSEPASLLAIDHAGYSHVTMLVENTTAVNQATAARFYKTTSGGTYSRGIWAHAFPGTGQRLVGGTMSAYSSTTNTINRTFGVRGIAGNGIDGYNWGVWGWLYGERNGAAVYGCTDGSEGGLNDQYAGYFKGKVEITGTLKVGGTYVTSDINLKKNIRPLANEQTRQIDQLMTLSAIKYNLKSPADIDLIKPEVADTMKIDPRTLEYNEPKYTADRIGLSAQDVREIYPELVMEDNDGYLSMNYTGLIPIMIEALKEQEAELALLREEIAKLKESATIK